MIYIFIICVALTSVWFYFGYVHKTESYLLPRIRGGFFIFTALSAITLFVLVKEQTAQNELAIYIAPYDGIDKAVYTPHIPGDYSQRWLFETPDLPKQVESFYTLEKNLEGWQVIRPFPFLKLRQGNKAMMISVTQQQKTLILYELITINTVKASTVND